jgi:hypothetical protein
MKLISWLFRWRRPTRLPHCPQFYETTVVDPNVPEASVRMVTFPSRSISPGLLFNLGALQSALQVDRLEPLSERGVRQLLEESVESECAEYSDQPPTDADLERAREFARDLLDTRVVPVEMSPLSGVTLSQVTKGGAAATGLWVAYLAVGQSPLLIVMAPVGIVICGAAMSFTKWFDSNRDELLARLLNVKRKRRDRRGSRQQVAAVRQEAADERLEQDNVVDPSLNEEQFPPSAGSAHKARYHAEPG